MKIIELAHRKNAKHRLTTMVDDDDFLKFGHLIWSKAGKYAARQLSRKGGIEKQTKVFLHRLILGLDNDRSTSVDHIDGNGLNNQKSNLRKCTHMENMYNRGSCKTSTSKYKGVCFDSTRGKWAAQITFNKSRKSLGRFNDEIDAAKAYNKAAINLHGEFARLNHIPS